MRRTILACDACDKQVQEGGGEWSKSVGPPEYQKFKTVNLETGEFGEHIHFCGDCAPKMQSLVYNGGVGAIAKAMVAAGEALAGDEGGNHGNSTPATNLTTDAIQDE